MTRFEKLWPALRLIPASGELPPWHPAHRGVNRVVWMAERVEFEADEAVTVSAGAAAVLLPASVTVSEAV